MGSLVIPAQLVTQVRVDHRSLQLIAHGNVRYRGLILLPVVENGQFRCTLPHRKRPVCNGVFNDTVESRSSHYTKYHREHMEQLAKEEQQQQDQQNPVMGQLPSVRQSATPSQPPVSAQQGIFRAQEHTLPAHSQQQQQHYHHQAQSSVRNPMMGQSSLMGQNTVLSQYPASHQQGIFHQEHTLSQPPHFPNQPVLPFPQGQVMQHNGNQFNNFYHPATAAQNTQLAPTCPAMFTEHSQYGQSMGTAQAAFGMPMWQPYNDNFFLGHQVWQPSVPLPGLGARQRTHHAANMNSTLQLPNNQRAQHSPYNGQPMQMAQAPAQERSYSQAAPVSNNEVMLDHLSGSAVLPDYDLQGQAGDQEDEGHAQADDGDDDESIHIPDEGNQDDFSHGVNDRERSINSALPDLPDAGQNIIDGNGAGQDGVAAQYLGLELEASFNPSPEELDELRMSRPSERCHMGAFFVVWGVYVHTL
ncbi:hypothetical protein GGR57DRAFT_455788 [Xylariaceae sp. FL1272]|nr:hypothetical protein GGR57DRAFT_455788 [Xylariaceae sp. FL1272]